jgi:putative ABC transport system permease protein
VNPGFESQDTVTMRVNLPSVRYPDNAKRTQFFDRVFEKIDAIPGVKSAGAVSFLALNGLGAATTYEVVGDPKPRGQEPVADVLVVSHKYLAAMSVPLLEGRLFNEGDASDATNKIVVSETMARTHWPGESPLGKRVRMSWTDRREDEIVGVVGDVRLTSLDAAPRATTYWPYARNPYGAMTIAVRASGDPRAVVNSVVGLIRQQDPDLAVADIRTMDEVVATSVAQQRLTTMLLGIFAGAALLLAVVGIYGVIAYSVTQRSREIGIRMALGAQRGDVLRMIVSQAAALVAAGIVIGGIGALLLTRLMEGMLFEVQPTDPMTFTVVAAVLALSALAASYVPGRRATRVDPVIALRAE